MQTSTHRGANSSDAGVTFDQLAAIKDREEKERGTGTVVLAHSYHSTCLLVQKYLHVDREEKERAKLGAGAGTLRGLYCY